LSFVARPVGERASTSTSDPVPIDLVLTS